MTQATNRELYLGFARATAGLAFSFAALVSLDIAWVIPFPMAVWAVVFYVLALRSPKPQDDDQHLGIGS